VSKEDLTGKNIVVTAGGTREAIDPVRHTGNRSPDKQEGSGGEGGGINIRLSRRCYEGGLPSLKL